MNLKKMQYRSIPVIGLVFLVIGLVLFAERSGIRAGEVASANYYLPEESVVTAEESAKDLQATCLLLTNKNSVESEELVSQFEQIFQDMKVGYQKIDVTDGSLLLQQMPLYRILCEWAIACTCPRE